jgi:anti-sigma-K factor RskA
MNPNLDDDLRARFEHARCCDRDDAPAWRPELLEQHQARRPSFGLWRWPAALAAACVIVLVVFLGGSLNQEPKLSEALPPLFEAPAGELFASLEPSHSLMSFEAPSDFLLTDSFHLSLP